MKSVKLFYLTHCPYCVKAKQAIAELHAENPEYEKVQIERINEEEHPEIAKQFDYYYVPTIFFGDEKLYEAQPGQNYEEIKDCIRKAFDSVLENIG